MNLSKLFIAQLLLALGAALPFAVIAEGYGHEFAVNLQSISLGGGSSGSSQSVDYKYYPQRVRDSDFPFAEAAFVAQSPYYSASLSSTGIDISGGSSRQWGFALKGRLALPDTPYFAEGGYARTALYFDPFMLSSAPSYDAVISTFNAGAGMVVATNTEVDLSVSQTNAEFDVSSDVSALTISLHGRTLLPAGERMFAALELAWMQTTAEVGSIDANSTGYNAKVTWYFTRTLSGVLGYGHSAGSTTPTIEYQSQDIGVVWSIEPEVMVTFDILDLKWDNDTNDRYATLRFIQRI